MRDDFTLEPSYDYGEEDEWDETDAKWSGEEELAAEDDHSEAKDESTAYLEFLNEEVIVLLAPLADDSFCV